MGATLDFGLGWRNSFARRRSHGMVGTRHTYLTQMYVFDGKTVFDVLVNKYFSPGTSQNEGKNGNDEQKFDRAKSLNIDRIRMDINDIFDDPSTMIDLSTTLLNSILIKMIRF